jgi:23S rRNA (adenine2503-C2)-methyltransferase
MFSWVYKKGITQNFTNISKKDQTFFQNMIDFSTPKIALVKESFDGTVKFLMEFSDQEQVETVLIFSEKRVTICLSSQVGCAMGCKFCHTATQGLKRHLKCSEIVGQYYVAQEWVKKNRNTVITNIVYMGQGEPLHNPKEVKTSVEIFLDPFAYYLGQRKITLSTSGLAKEIENFKDFPPINLAISLHSTRDEVRSRLMPINKAYNLATLFKALSKVPLKAHRRITYEYLLIDGINDQAEDIEGLIRLLNPREAKINLIPFNEFPGSEFKRPSDKRIDWFMKQLISYGFCCTIRQTKGPDILAACGQLKSTQQNLL